MGLLSFFGIGRGKIKVILNTTSFVFGEKIKGNLEIKLKKPISTNFTEVSLILERRTTKMRDGKKSTDVDILHEDKVRLANEQQLNPGIITVPFEIQIPKADFPKFVNAGLVQTVKTVGMLLGTSVDFVWSIKGHVDVPKAIDMRSKKIRISINPATNTQTTAVN